MSDLSNSLGRMVGEEMGKVLQRPPLAYDDDFFVFGGDSLRAVALISRLVERWQQDGAALAEKLQAELLVAVFDDPTPRFLSEVIEQHVNHRIPQR